MTGQSNHSTADNIKQMKQATVKNNNQINNMKNVVAILCFVFIFNTINASEKFNIKIFIENLPEIELPFVWIGEDNGVFNEQPLSQEQLDMLSFEKVHEYRTLENNEKEVSIICRFEMKEGFHLLWAKIYPHGVERNGFFISSLLYYDNNYQFIGSIPFAGNCFAQCYCIIYSIVYDRYIKNFELSECPYENETYDEFKLRILSGYMRKFEIDKEKGFIEIQTSYIPEPLFTKHHVSIAFLPDKKKKAIIDDADGYTNIRTMPNITSRIVTTVSDNEIFYFWEDATEDWWFVEKENGLEGFMHKS